MPYKCIIKYIAALVLVSLFTLDYPLRTSAAILIKLLDPTRGCQLPTCAKQVGVPEFQCWPLTPCDLSKGSEVECNGSAWTLSYYSRVGICPNPNPGLSLPSMQFRGSGTTSCGRLLGSYFTVDCSRNECPTLQVCGQTCPQGATGRCDFYSNCVEATIPCGPQGYALAFGQRYCDMYMTNLAYFSDRGQQWVRSVALCLQEALLPIVRAPNVTCTNITEAAMASHVSCYVKPTNDPTLSICTLPVNDWLLIMRIVGSAIFSDEWLAVIGQMFSTLERCGLQTESGDLHLNLNQSTHGVQIAPKSVRSLFTVYLTSTDDSSLLKEQQLQQQKLDLQTIRAVQAALQTMLQPAPICVFVTQHPTSATEPHAESPFLDPMSSFNLESRKYTIRLAILLLPNNDWSGDTADIIHNLENDLVILLQSRQLMPMMVHLPSGELKLANLTDFTIAEVHLCDALQAPCFSEPNSPDDSRSMYSDED